MHIGFRQRFIILTMLLALQACMTKEEQMPLLLGAWQGSSIEGSWCFTLHEDFTLRILNLGFAKGGTAGYTLKSTGSWEINDGGRLRFRLSQHQFADGHSNSNSNSNSVTAQNSTANNNPNEKIVKYYIRRLNQKELAYHEQSGNTFGTLQVSNRITQCDFDALTLNQSLFTISSTLDKKV